MSRQELIDQGFEEAFGAPLYEEDVQKIRIMLVRPPEGYLFEWNVTMPDGEKFVMQWNGKRFTRRI